MTLAASLLPGDEWEWLQAEHVSVFLPKAFDSESHLFAFHIKASADLPMEVARAQRFSSRSAQLLLLQSEWMAATIASRPGISPFRIGLYLALENGPVLPEGSKHIDFSDCFAEKFRQMVPPKQFLKYLVPVAPTALAARVGVRGPVVIYNSRAHGCRHALARARLDLASGAVELAFVATCLAKDEPVPAAALQAAGSSVSACMSEISLAVAFSGHLASLEGLPHALNLHTHKKHFGIADPMVRLLTTGALE